MIYPVLLLSLSFHSGIMASVCQLDFALIVIHTFGKSSFTAALCMGDLFSHPLTSAHSLLVNLGF